MSITIRLATATDFEAVAALRLAAYRAAPEFTVSDEAAIARWDGQVLVAENEEGLLATMQVVGGGLIQGNIIVVNDDFSSGLMHHQRLAKRTGFGAEQDLRGLPAGLYRLQSGAGGQRLQIE